MSNNNERANFSEEVKLKLRIRVGGWCSNLSCEYTKGIINNGDAAHIYAASSRGLRPNPNMPYEDRKSEKNGIWLCCNCHRDVDNKNSGISAAQLKGWKTDAIESNNKRIKEIIKKGHSCRIETKVFNYAVLAFILQVIDYLNELHENIDKFRRFWTDINKKEAYSEYETTIIKEHINMSAKRTYDTFIHLCEYTKNSNCLSWKGNSFIDIIYGFNFDNCEEPSKLFEDYFNYFDYFIIEEFPFIITDKWKLSKFIEIIDNKDTDKIKEKLIELLDNAYKGYLKEIGKNNI